MNRIDPLGLLCYGYNVSFLVFDGDGKLVRELNFGFIPTYCDGGGGGGGNIPGREPNANKQEPCPPDLTAIGKALTVLEKTGLIQLIDEDSIHASENGKGLTFNFSDPEEAIPFRAIE